jgi:hypothetical protein
VLARMYLSNSHLKAACLFLNHAKKCEEERSEGKDPGYSVHRAYVTSTVMLSAAFLEATINELFSDCADDWMSSKHPPAKELMATLWNRGIPRRASYSIIDKFDIALELNKQVPSEAISNHLRADVKLMIDLRNALIHYEPETLKIKDDSEPIDQDKLHKFEKRAKGKFVTNPFSAPTAPFYPGKIFGYGCAAWSVKTAVSFADAFFKSLGIEARHESMRDEINNATA